MQRAGLHKLPPEKHPARKGIREHGFRVQLVSSSPGQAFSGPHYKKALYLSEPFTTLTLFIAVLKLGKMLMTNTETK